MCGIVGAIAQRDVSPILLEGLIRLEYRGYDSAGIAVLKDHTHKINRIRVKGKVAHLADALAKKPLVGHLGIAHTRWATHGVPSKKNAHPHCSQNTIAVVHNGIIENRNHLYQKLCQLGYEFTSHTDTEVIAHLLHYHSKSSKNTLSSIKKTIAALKGTYALGIINAYEPQVLYAVRVGSPLIIGIGTAERFIASDLLALSSVAKRFIQLEDGDIAHIESHTMHIYDSHLNAVKRNTQTYQLNAEQISKGKYRHYMKKEIFEQPKAIADTLQHYFPNAHFNFPHITNTLQKTLQTIKRIHIIACGTSYHAGLIGKHWIEQFAQLPCQVEIASENLYQVSIVEPHTLFIALSQSGETADTLSAIRQAKKKGYAVTLGISNTPQSALMRESDIALVTQAGIEIGVAATKTFTSQLLMLLLFSLFIRHHNLPSEGKHNFLLLAFKQLPQLLKKTLALDTPLKKIAQLLQNKKNALFLGRNIMFPVALEGALKLKEISYIHAEAYPAGELKHGPLALIDAEMPTIVIVPHDDTLEKKLEANINEIHARGGQLIVLSDERIKWHAPLHTANIKIPATPLCIAPIIYTIPLQLLAYHVAVLKGTDVDQPRHLAKSVTVE